MGIAIAIIVTFLVTGAGLVVAVAAMVKVMTGMSDVERRSKAAGFTLMNATARPGQTVFVGDSITDNYKVAEFYAEYTARTGQLVYNRGISGESSDELLARWDDVLALAPSRLVVLIGTNDLAHGTVPDVVAGHVREALRRAREAGPDVEIVLEAVYPINPGLTKGIARLAMKGRKSPETIAALNTLLRAVSDEYDAHWLDLTTALSDASGALNPAYSYDGLHLNAAGYQVVTRNVRPLLDPAAAKDGHR